MTASDLDILDDPFHGAAFAAFVEQAALAGGPPDMDATRRCAFELYEQHLAEKHGGPRSGE